MKFNWDGCFKTISFKLKWVSKRLIFLMEYLNPHRSYTHGSKSHPLSLSLPIARPNETVYLTTKSQQLIFCQIPQLFNFRWFFIFSFFWWKERIDLRPSHIALPCEEMKEGTVGMLLSRRNFSYLWKSERMNDSQLQLDNWTDEICLRRNVAGSLEYIKQHCDVYIYI